MEAIEVQAALSEWRKESEGAVGAPKICPMRGCCRLNVCIPQMHLTPSSPR